MSAGKGQAGTRKYSLLVVVKGKHRYLVKYDPTYKQRLFDLLLQYGQDDNYNLTCFDALALIERLEGHKSGSSVISLSEEEPAVECDLTFDGPPADVNEPDAGLDF